MDRALSLLLVRIIKAAYLPAFLSAPGATAKTAVEALGLELVTTLHGNDFNGLFGLGTVPYGIVARNPTTGQIYVGLRGTENASEWAIDFFALLTACGFLPGCKVHKGIYDLYGTLVTAEGVPAFDFLWGLDAVISGHSLGAALAELLAAQLGKHCDRCITFEGPRVFDLAGAELVDETVPAHWRYIVIGDLVPHAPPELNGYFHAGIEVDLDPSSINLPSLPFARAKALHVIATVEALLAA
jgi:hypothetical protein